MHLQIGLALLAIATISAQPVAQKLPPTESPGTSTRRPGIIVEEAEPLIYHFVTEHRPTHLGQNYYLKPGQVLGTFTLNSDTLQVRHKDSDGNGKPVASKHNILFVAYAKDVPQKTTQNPLQ
ncbi:hypothetical protein KR018_010049 [Drosophila ironensis]|nr:hypothetical protein KR018_010049 [Drosophila ironensis]